MDDRWKKSKEGNITLEITLLMPFILGVLVLIIYWGFYLHDRGILLSYSQQLALQVSKGEEETHQADLTRRLIIAYDSDIQIEKDEDQVQIIYRSSINFLPPLITNILPRNWKTIEGNVEVKKNKEVNFIRKYKKAKEILEKGES